MRGEKEQRQIARIDPKTFKNTLNDNGSHSIWANDNNRKRKLQVGVPSNDYWEGQGPGKWQTSDIFSMTSAVGALLLKLH